MRIVKAWRTWPLSGSFQRSHSCSAASAYRRIASRRSGLGPGRLPPSPASEAMHGPGAEREPLSRRSGLAEAWPDTDPRPASPQPRLARTLMLVTACAGAATVAVAIWQARRYAPPVYLTALVDIGTVARSVSASGMVNPVETVQLGSYVSGPDRGFRLQPIASISGQECAIAGRSRELPKTTGVEALGCVKIYPARAQASHPTPVRPRNGPPENRQSCGP